MMRPSQCICGVQPTIPLIALTTFRYKARQAKPYELPKVTLKQIHDAVPKELHKKSTLKGVSWALRDLILVTAFYQVRRFIP